MGYGTNTSVLGLVLVVFCLFVCFLQRLTVLVPSKLVCLFVLNFSTYSCPTSLLETMLMRRGEQKKQLWLCVSSSTSEELSVLEMTPLI